MPLRCKDAIVALAGNHNLARQWDHKIRDQVLRALPSYRSCPKCNKDGEISSSLGGGGFVTPECLLPCYKKWGTQAVRVLKLWPVAAVGMFSVFLGYCNFISRFPSKSILADMIFMMLPIPTFYKLASRSWSFECDKHYGSPFPSSVPVATSTLYSLHKVNYHQKRTVSWPMSIRRNRTLGRVLPAVYRLPSRVDAIIGDAVIVALFLLGLHAIANEMSSLPMYQWRRKCFTFAEMEFSWRVSCYYERNVGPVQYIATCVLGSAITMFFGSKLVLGSIWAYIILLVVLLPVSQAGGGEKVHGHGQRNLRQRQVEHTLAFVDNWIQ
jgi:hypothetical protein